MSKIRVFLLAAALSLVAGLWLTPASVAPGGVKVQSARKSQEFGDLRRRPA